jgi:hypothetical protein
MNKKIKEITITPQQRHQELNACINCVFENECKTLLPFPICLEECCDKYRKTEYKEKL